MSRQLDQCPYSQINARAAFGTLLWLTMDDDRTHRKLEFPRAPLIYNPKYHHASCPCICHAMQTTCMSIHFILSNAVRSLMFLLVYNIKLGRYFSKITTGKQLVMVHGSQTSSRLENEHCPSALHHVHHEMRSNSTTCGFKIHVSTRTTQSWRIPQMLMDARSKKTKHELRCTN